MQKKLKAKWREK